MKRSANFVLIILVLTFLLCGTAFAQCVTKDELSFVLSNNAPKDSSFGNMFTTADCDPCKCPTSMSECYEFMAGREREKERINDTVRDIHSRYFKYGLCK